ncbi:hypothetical protein ACF09L_32880 [Streptomyces sp. NPDC014779]|uniref:hypothetical protein n=1 Tax=Streptomyces sp. NPDC014779 TaxID=3364911 RepID=UPI0036FF9860
MNAKRVNAAAGVILAALKSKRTAAGIAADLESACLLQSPETAAELARRRTEDLALRVELAPMGAPRRVPFELGASLLPAVRWLVARESDLIAQVSRLANRVAELEAERHSTNEALSDAAAELNRRRDRIAELEAKVRRLNTLHGDAAQLIDQERACGAECVDIADLEAALMLGGPSEGELAEQRHLVDPLDHALEALAPHTAPAKCRCAEPDADPYECEAEDCTHPFSELSPFAGARSVNAPSANLSRTCGVCGWRTSVWHVDDGSADQELHDHISRAHAPNDLPHPTDVRSAL